MGEEDSGLSSTGMRKRSLCSSERRREVDGSYTHEKPGQVAGTCKLHDKFVRELCRQSLSAVMFKGLDSGAGQRFGSCSLPHRPNLCTLCLTPCHSLHGHVRLARVDAGFAASLDPAHHCSEPAVFIHGHVFTSVSPRWHQTWT